MRWLVVSLILGALACDGPALEDAGVEDSAVDAGGVPPTVPDPPVEPAPPMLTPCPAGWSEVAIGGATGCEPWPIDRADCPAGTHRFPGDTDCAPLSDPCPVDGWPSGVDASAVFVRDGAAAGGDGSRSAPFATIAEGLAAASDGGVVALASGTYAEAVRIERSVTLRGACAEGTMIAPPMVAVDPPPAVDVRAADVSAQDLSITSTHWGLAVTGGALRAQRVHVDAAVRFGLVVAGGGSIVADALVIADVGGDGVGVAVNDTSTATLRRAVVTRVSTFGVLVYGVGASIDLQSVSVRGVAPGSPGLGNGIVVDRMARATVVRSSVERAAASGVFAQNAVSVELTDVLVRATALGGGRSPTGFGVSVGDTALTLTRVTIDDNFTAGVLIDDSPLTVRDLVVHNTNGDDDTGGAGVVLNGIVSATLERAWLEDNTFAGLFAFGPAAELEASDLTILSTRATPAGLAGHGLALELGPQVVVRRLRVEDATEVGILVNQPGGMLDVEDVTVLRTRSNANEGSLGRALSVQLASTARVARARFEDNREVSVLAYGDGTSIELSHAVIARTGPRECAATTCRGFGGGTGLSAVVGARIELSAFVVEDHDLVGLQVADRSSLVVSDGIVRGNPVGVNVQLPVFDIADYTNRVTYLDNGVNLDSREIFLPAPRLE